MPDKIEGGYILFARKTLESEIMDKPPLYFKLWGWMLMQAKFKPKNGLNRGQFKTSIKEMQSAMSYLVGYRKETPTAKQIRGIYESLTKGSMIGTTKVTGGLIITILNYDKYQDPKNYEGHNEVAHEGKSKGTSYTIEEGEERKNDDSPPAPKKPKKKKQFVPPNVDDVVNYFVENGYLASAGEKAHKYYSAGGWKDKNGKQVKNWKQKMIGVWFKDENKQPVNGTHRKTPEQIQAEMKEALS
jgi:uncharacterized protein YneF (UPF0154 family)